MQIINAIAPAKINLLLLVDPRRECDGFHNVTNVMQTISLHDTLTTKIENFSKDDADYHFSNQNINISFNLKIKGPSANQLEISAKENLVIKAAQQTLSSCLEKCDLHFDIEIEKNIPIQAGLGGGSSDCAAMLKTLETAFEEVQNADVRNVSPHLGADVPFLLDGGRREMKGSGTILSKEMDSLTSPIILVKPKSGISTKKCFELFDKIERERSCTFDLKRKNDLQQAACQLNPEIADVLSFLQEKCGNSLMSGSGSCCFAFVNSHFDARKIVGEAQLKGWWCRACSCTNLGATVLE